MHQYIIYFYNKQKQLVAIKGFTKAATIVYPNYLMFHTMIIRENPRWKGNTNAAP